MKIYYSTILLFFCHLAMAQDVKYCATPSLSDQEKQKRPHYGNDKHLVDILNREGYDVPSDYFRLIDENGFYRGEKLKLYYRKKFRRDKEDENNSPGRTEARGGGGYSFTTYYLPVKFWVYWDMAGSGATQEMMDSAMIETQSLFRNNGLNVELYYKEDPEYIFSSYVELGSENERDNMFSEYKDPNALNIHLVREAPWGGSARFRRPWCTITRHQIVDHIGGFATMAHELGHNFDLLHTHDGGTFYDDNATRNNCNQESVSRTKTQPVGCHHINYRKCLVNGDLLCDTQASYKALASDVFGCGYNPIAVTTDNWNQPWTPDVDNIMSYSDDECRNELSYGQVAVALGTVSGENSFDFYTTTSNTFITGSSVLCPNRSYTFSVPDYSGARGYHWEVVPPDFEITSGQGTRTVTITTGNHYWEDYTIYCTPLISGQKPAKKEVTINPLDLDIHGYDEIPDDGVDYPFYTDNYGTTYTWSVPGGWALVSGQGTRFANIKANPGAGPGYVNVSSSNCGVPMAGSKYVTIGSGGGPQARYDEVLSANEYDVKTRNVKIYSMSGKLLEQCDMEISTDGPVLPDYPSGFYIVKYLEGTEIKTYKVLKR